jgi:hypothetical protein
VLETLDGDALGGGRIDGEMPDGGAIDGGILNGSAIDAGVLIFMKPVSKVMRK